MLAVALGLAVSGCLGVSDFLAGTRARSVPLAVVLGVSQATGLVALLVVVAAVRPSPPDGETVLLALGAGVAACVGTAALYRGLAVGTMSVVAPISAASALVPVAAGVLAGESPAATQRVGIAVTVAGVMLAARAVDDPTSDRRVGGVGLALVAALAGGLFIVAMSEATEHSLLWAAIVARGCVLALVVAAAAASRSPRGVPRLDATLPAIGLLETVSWLMLGAAAQRGLLSVVGVLVSLYPAVTVALARAVHGETLARHQALGIAAVLAGVGLLSAG